MDLPGEGCSAPLPSDVPYTVDAITCTIGGFIRELRVERPQVVGNSLGGAIGLELARRGVAGAATAISPIGFWSSLGANYGVLALHCLRGLSTLLRPVAPRLLPSMIGRSILFTPVAGRPWRITPADAAQAYAAFLSAPAFDARALAAVAASTGRGGLDASINMKATQAIAAKQMIPIAGAM